MKFYENIAPIDVNQYLISIDNGFSLLNLKHDNFKSAAVPIPLIRNIRSLLVPIAFILMMLKKRLR